MATRTEPSFRLMYYKHSNTVTGTTSKSDMMLDCSKTKVGDPVPGWRQKISSLADATGPYSLTMRSLNAGEGTISQALIRVSDGMPVTAKITGNWLTTPGALGFPGHDSNVTNGVVGRFYQKLSDALAPFKGAVFLGELKETCALLVSLCRNLFSSFREITQVVRHLRADLRRRLRALYRRARREFKRKKALLIRAFLERVSELWLTWAFGISPLLADIESAAEVLCDSRVEIRTVKATNRGADRLTSSSVGVGYLWQNCASYIVQTSTMQKTSCRVIGAVKAVKPLVENSLEGSADRWGLTFREFIPTVWELTPWSFLVDYFVNVGNVLTAVSYHDVDLVYAVVSKRSEMTWKVVAKAGSSGSINGYRVVGGPTGAWSGEQKSVQFNRTKLSLSDVGFSVRYPDFWTQYANMLALLITKVKGCRLSL